MITNVCLVWLQMAISYTTDAIQMECSQPTTPMEVSVLLLKHVPPTDNAMLRAQIWMVQINAVCHRPVWQGPWLRGWVSSLQEFGKNGRPFISCLHFFFFLKVEISLHTLISLFRPGSVHSGSVSWDDCGQVFPCELHVRSFSQIGSHTMPGSQHSQSTVTLLGQGCMHV